MVLLVLLCSAIYKLTKFVMRAGPLNQVRQNFAILAKKNNLFGQFWIFNNRQIYEHTLERIFLVEVEHATKRFGVRILRSVNFIHSVEKTRNKEKEAGNGPIFQQFHH